jgi:effector-binding domain-containing protein
MFMAQGTMKDMFRKGLKNLEAASKEDQKNGIQYGDYLITTEDYDSQVLVGVREAKVNMNELEDFFSSAYGRIYRNLSRNEIEIASPPMAVYYTWDEENQVTDCAAALVLEEDLEVAGLDRFRITRARALLTTVKGNYEQLGAAHGALEEAAQDMGLVLQPPMIEIYEVGPEQAENQEDFVTKIIYRYAYPD